MLFLGYSRSQVNRKIRNCKLHGSSTGLPSLPPGPDRMLGEAEDAFIEALLGDRPWLWLEEIQKELFSRRGIDVSITTVWRAVTRLGLKSKILRRDATQRSALRRAEFDVQLTCLTPEQLVYVDETAVNEATMNRRRGRAPTGITPVSQQPLRRTARWTVLPAYSIAGYLPRTLVVQN